MGQKWLHWDYTSLKILSQFTYNYSKKRNSLEISKDTKIPLRTVSRKLKWFAENNFIKCMTEGKNKKYFLDLYNPLTYHLLINLESFKALEFIKNNQKISLYLKTLDEKIMIFGSFAKYGQGNDLDIVIFNNKEIELAPLDIHPQNISIKEFKKLLMTKNSFAKEIADNHILFNNFDEFIKILIEAYNE
jgi:hypothetical protein